MKTFTRVLALLLAVLMTFVVFTACKEDKTEQCSVTFANTSLNAQSVEKGQTVAKPEDPEKEGNIFVGWYTDADFQTEAQFPITVNENTTVYAKFYTYGEAFQKARNNTVGDDVPGFSYSYTLDATATVAAVNLNGHTAGTAKYSKTGGVNFYDEHTNSGILFYDGSKYQIRRGTTLQNVAMNEEGEVTSFSVAEVDASYKYDSSSFAKAVFTYSDDQLKTIEKTDQKNVYKLKTAMNASAAIALVGNNLNNPKVAKIIGTLPATDVNTGMYVTFSGDKIASYKYEMIINVSALQFNLTYTLNITDSGTALNITPRTFQGVALTPAEIGQNATTAAAFVTTFKNKAQSGYDFRVDTGVDYGATSGEINSTFQGSARRKVDGNEVYFHNDIEIDSDYKNTDLYKTAGIKDVHIKETRLANGEVWLIEKKLLADNTQQVTPFTPGENTSYYLFNVLAHVGTYTFADIKVKDGVTSYGFGLSNAGVAELLTWLNASLDLDPLSTATADVQIYGNFDPATLKVNTGKLTIKVQNGVLIGIQIKVEGDATTSFAGSAGFTTADKAQIKLDYTLTPIAAGDTFEPYTTVNAAK